MAQQDMDVEEKPCPCGKGTYTHQITRDEIIDCSQYPGLEESFAMHCPRCREMYEDVPWPFDDGRRWVSRDLAKEYGELSSEILKPGKRTKNEQLSIDEKKKRWNELIADIRKGDVLS